jgi:recombinational DNA repair protein (RecF pathway)
MILTERNPGQSNKADSCGKCGNEIDPARRVDFTLKDGTRVCEACFVKGTAESSKRQRDTFSV